MYITYRTYVEDMLYQNMIFVVQFVRYRTDDKAIVTMSNNPNSSILSSEQHIENDF